MVVTQGIETEASQVSHTSGSKNNLSWGHVFLGDVKALTPLLFPAAMLSSSFASVPRAAGGDAGSLGARATAAIIKQRETFYFFVTDPASGKWQLAEGRETKQAFARPEKASSPLWHFLAFSPPLTSLPPQPLASWLRH